MTILGAAAQQHTPPPPPPDVPLLWATIHSLATTNYVNRSASCNIYSKGLPVLTYGEVETQTAHC
jgi:hypothetical protein